MFSYTAILKQAYYLTRRHPLLWLFGMFLIGSFNLSFLRMQSLLPDVHFSDLGNLPAALLYFQDHPARLGLTSLSLLTVAVVSLLLTNWSKVMLLLLAKAELDRKPEELAVHIKRSASSLWPVIKASMLTSVFMVAALAILVAPIFVDNVLLQNALWMLSAAICFLVVFTVSSVNIFTTMFIVLFKLPLKKALDVATDFFATNWTSLLGLVAILLVVYLAGFGLGWGILGLFKALGGISLLNAEAGGALQNSTVFIIIKTLGGLVLLALWVWLGMLNAFLNISLLLFFLQKITPTKSEEPKAVPEAVPAPAVP
jgi:hypothetical protein